MGSWGGELLERNAQIGVVLRAVSAARDGPGSVVLVSGEAGIGKTSVVRAALARLGREVRILVGACDDLRTSRPLGPLRDAARGTGGPLESAVAAGSLEPVFDAAVAELARPPVTVLVVEDVHWVDDATLDVLRHLARRIVGVLVLTYRADEVGPTHPLRALLGELGGVPVHRLRLEPLSQAAVATLARDSRRDGAELHAVTSGNPFFVTEALAAPATTVPRTVTDAVVARVGQLDADCRAALEQLAVVPTEVDFGLADALLGPGVDLLDEAERRGVLEVRSAGLAFRHELARLAVESSLPVIRRRKLNRAVVTALLAQKGQDLDRVVHHAIEAGDGETVAAYAPAAGRQAAALGSHRQALTHFEAALRHGDRLDPPQHARLLDDAAWELYNARRFDDALLLAGEAVETYELLDDHASLGEALVRHSRHLYMAGDTDGAEHAVERAVTVLDGPDADPAALAYALTNLGSILALTERPAAAVEVLERAHGLAAAAGRTDLVAICLNYLGTARVELEGEPGLAALRGSLTLAVHEDLDECTARGYTNLAEPLYRFGRYDELARVLDDGLAFTRDRGFWSHAYNLDVHRCLLLARRGDWAAAEEGLRELVSSDEPGMLYVYSVPPHARMLARRGHPEAGPLLAEAWRRAREQRSFLGLAFAGLATVEWAWLAGHPERAAEVADVLLSRRDRPGAAPVLGELLRYLARAGVEANPFPGCPEPWASGLRGDWAAAAAMWAEIGDPYEQALELASSNEIEPTLEGLRILDLLEARAPAALVRRRLAELGMTSVPRGPAARTRTNPAGLTDRQVDVLRLLADGLTNAEIAARLVLSVRTVDHHVAAVFDKLGVRTRREAAATARSLDLDHQP